MNNKMRQCLTMRIVCLSLIMLFAYSISGAEYVFCDDDDDIIATDAGKRLRPTAGMDGLQLESKENLALETINIKNSINSKSLQFTAKSATTLDASEYIRTNTLTSRFSMTEQFFKESISRARLESASPIEREKLYELAKRLGLSLEESGDETDDAAGYENVDREGKKDLGGTANDADKYDDFGIWMDTLLSGDQTYLGDGSWLITMDEGDDEAAFRQPYLNFDFVTTHFDYPVNGPLGVERICELQDAFNKLKGAKKGLYRPMLKDALDGLQDEPSSDKSKIKLFDQDENSRDNKDIKKKDVKNRNRNKTTQAAPQDKPVEKDHVNIPQSSTNESGKARPDNSSSAKGQLFNNKADVLKATITDSIKGSDREAQKSAQSKEAEVDLVNNPLHTTVLKNELIEAKENLKNVCDEITTDDPGAVVYTTEGNNEIGAIILLPALANAPLPQSAKVVNNTSDAPKEA